MATKPHALAAFTRDVIPYLDKTLGSYVDVVWARTLEEALEWLKDDRSIVIVLCGVFFNGSRMFELMRHVKKMNPQLPFVACRILPLELPGVSIEALTIALESLGARYVDVPQLEEQYGQEQAQSEFRSVVLSKIPRTALNSDLRPLQSHRVRSANHSGRPEYPLLDYGVDEYFTSFRREKDGIWVCLEPVTIRHPEGRIEVAPGRSLRKGNVYMGVDLAAWLDEQLLNALKHSDSEHG